MYYLWLLMKSFFILIALFLSTVCNAQERPHHYLSNLLSSRDIALIGQNLYQDLQQRRWNNAEVLLQHYQQLPQHEILLVYYAKAQLALAKGNLLQAEYYYHQQLKQKQDFIPAQTGLTDLYFYQKNYIKAKEQLKKLSEINDLSISIKNKIKFYQTTLSPYFKTKWLYQIGIIYNDNVNLASDYQEEVISNTSLTTVTRKGRESKKSEGMSHFLSFYQPHLIKSAHLISMYLHSQYINSDYPLFMK